MKQANNGGAELSVPLNPGEQYQHGPTDGITLRQYYAGMAMQGMLAHPTRYTPRDQDSHLHWHDALAKEASEIADAMILVHKE